MTTVKVLRHDSYPILTELLPSYPLDLIDLIDSYLRCNFVPDLAKIVRKLQAHSDWITALLTLPSGSLLSSSHDGTIRRWNVAEGKLEHTYTVQGEVRALCLGPSTTFYSGGVQELRVWNSTDCVSTITIPGTSTICYALVRPPASDGKTLICGGPNEFFSVLDVETEKFTPLPRIKADVWGLCTVETHENLFASALSNHTVGLWDLRDNKQVAVLSGHSSCVNVVRAVDTKQLASGADDHSIFIWDIGKQSKVATLTGHNHHVRDLAVTQEGDLVSVSSNRANSLCLWSTRTWTKTQSWNSKGYISTCVNMDGSVSAGGEKQNPEIDVYGVS